MLVGGICATSESPWATCCSAPSSSTEKTTSPPPGLTPSNPEVRPPASPTPKPARRSGTVMDRMVRQSPDQVKAAAEREGGLFLGGIIAVGAFAGRIERAVIGQPEHGEIGQDHQLEKDSDPPVEQHDERH